MQGENPRNMVFTPHSPQCRICHFSGYSNDCSFFSTGKCSLMVSMREVAGVKK